MRTDLDFLLVEYEQKRRNAENELDKRKLELYKKNPRLEEIEDEINKISINKTKSILINKLSDSLSKKFDEDLINLKKEKEDILKKEKIDESFFKPKYECKKCKDTGYIKSLNQKSEMCSCLKQRLINISYNKSNLSNLQKENFENFNANIFSNQKNVEKYKINISPRENIKTIRKAAENFVNNFDNPDTKNLFFTGNTGLGKTFMTNCIANELLNRGKTVLYQTAPVLLETIIDNKFNKYKTNDTNDFNNQVLDTDLLIIDDLGTECINSMKLSELFTIINSRCLNLNNKVTKTIISTNFNIEQIFEIYEERIGSRIAGFYDIYYFFGEDFRLKK